MIVFLNQTNESMKKRAMVPMELKTFLWKLTRMKRSSNKDLFIHTTITKLSKKTHLRFGYYIDLIQMLSELLEVYYHDI
jgi:hypothetical protein